MLVESKLKPSSPVRNHRIRVYVDFRPATAKQEDDIAFNAFIFTFLFVALQCIMLASFPSSLNFLSSSHSPSF